MFSLATSSIKSLLHQVQVAALSSTSTEWVQLPEYSLEQVSWHTSNDDCWIVIEDKVYDITKFIRQVNTNLQITFDSIVIYLQGISLTCWSFIFWFWFSSSIRAVTRLCWNRLVATPRWPSAEWAIPATPTTTWKNTWSEYCLPVKESTWIDRDYWGPSDWLEHHRGRRKTCRPCKQTIICSTDTCC